VAGNPVGLSLGSPDRNLLKRLQALLTTPDLDVKSTTDMAGVELGGALKNVFAVVAGIFSGCGLGDSLPGDFFTRAMVEMRDIGLLLGGRWATFSGRSGLGDLVVTCTPASRNFRFGRAYARLFGELYGHDFRKAGAGSSPEASTFALDGDAAPQALEVPETRGIPETRGATEIPEAADGPASAARRDGDDQDRDIGFGPADRSASQSSQSSPAGHAGSISLACPTTSSSSPSGPTSPASPAYSADLAAAHAHVFERTIDELGTRTVEGFDTLAAVHSIVRDRRMFAPIILSAHRVLQARELPPCELLAEIRRIDLRRRREGPRFYSILLHQMLPRFYYRRQ